MSVLDDIIAWENGDLSHDETVAFFQSLVDSGLAWKLQGVYGRTARDLIEAGEVTAPRDRVLQPHPLAFATRLEAETGVSVDGVPIDDTTDYDIESDCSTSTS